MNNKIIHQVWLGGKEIPSKFLSLREKLLEFHPEWTYKLWNEDTINKELGLLPNQYFHGTFAGSSNIIRLHSLKKFGGIYLDFDFEILKPFDKLLQYSCFVAKQPDGVFCNALFGSVPESKWI